MSIMIKATTTCAVEGHTRKKGKCARKKGKVRGTRGNSLWIHGYISKYICREYRDSTTI